MIYNVSNKFVNFLLIDKSNININELKKYLGNYITLNKLEKTEIYNKDLTIVLLDKNNSKIKSNAFLIDNHLVYLEGNELYIFVEKNNKNEIIFIKRLLIDLINRFFEKKQGIFLHSSSIVDSNNSIVFIGDKGSGKTTNMLYMLDKGSISYSSNERTGIIYNNGILLTYGNPARINIRANSLKFNDSLRNKLIGTFDMERYLEYSNMDLPVNCEERLVVSFEDISSKLNVPIVPIAPLNSICNLKYDKNIDFMMEKVDYESMKKDIEKSIITGVFPKRQKLNDLFATENTNYDTLLKNNKVNYYNIYQNNTSDNSEKIIKVLRRGY